MVFVPPPQPVAIKQSTLQPVQIDQLTGKTLFMSQQALVTTSTPSQIVYSYTVPANQNLYLCYLNIEGRLSAKSGTLTDLGVVQFQIPYGYDINNIQHFLRNDNTGCCDRISYDFAVPLCILGGGRITGTVTPSSATSMTWQINLGGYLQ